MKLCLRLMLILLCAYCLTLSLSAQDSTSDDSKEEEIPPEMPLVDEGDYDIVNFLLLGTATENFYAPGLTDSMMIVSVNRDVEIVSVVSLPRDLWVYIAGHGMEKINTAYFFGQLKDDDVTGIDLLKDTIRYNLGVEIDYYARINFNGLKNIVDTLGGVNLTVDCSLQDWKLKSPELDPNEEDNWELFTLWGGIHHLDGETALWYARSRRTSSDLDRSRRQQDLLRAIWRTFRQRDMVGDLPAIYEQVQAVVDTDISTDVMLSFAPLALQVETGDVEYYGFRIHEEIENAFSKGEGRAILEINPEKTSRLMQNLVLPPTLSQLSNGHPTIALVNAASTPDGVRIAADRLELEGFHTVILDEVASYRNWNHIIDYTGASKGNPIGDLQRVLRVTEEGITVEPDPNRQYDYKVYIGGNYSYNACTRNVLPPKPLDENGDVIVPTPESEGA